MMELDGVPDEANPFDLESYIGNYSSHTKVDRLEFIANKCAGTQMELDALRLAVDELKNSHNTARYIKVIEAAGDRLGSNHKRDEDWITSTDRKAHQMLERLEGLLANYKTNLVKESIRMGHNDLGDFYYEKGDLQNAFKCYVRSRDYCTTPKHVLSMCLNVIKVSIEMNNYVHASNYVQKAEQTPDLQDPLIIGKLRCSSGLAALANKKYKQAARKFVQVPVELGTHYSEVFAPQDVATYGGLCALATFDRAELKKDVINNIVFLEFLELVPEIREIIHDFYNSRYASCLKYLKSIRPSLLLDIHLSDHVENLYNSIRNRALIQYVTPFTSVDLTRMAEAFNTTVSGLEGELAALIMEDQIKARIDSHNKLLYAKHADTRKATFQKAVATGEEYERQTNMALLRTSLRQNDFVVRPKAGGRQGHGPGGGERGFHPDQN